VKPSTLWKEILIGLHIIGTKQVRKVLQAAVAVVPWVKYIIF